MTKEQLIINNILQLKDVKRFGEIIERIKKINMCCHMDCGAEKAQVKFNSADNSYQMIHHTKTNSCSITLSTDEIFTILDNINDEQVNLLGFKPDLSHPRNYILQTLPVLPPVDRPYVELSGNVWDDDLNDKYRELLKQMKKERINDPN